MVPQIDQHEGSLLCPNCGFDYISHGKVEVFNRNEDAATGNHTTVNGMKTSKDQCLDGNPSTRRHGLLVYFKCEGCFQVSVLSIAQHTCRRRQSPGRGLIREALLPILSRCTPPVSTSKSRPPGARLTRGRD